MDTCRALIHENISYVDLIREYPCDADVIDGYVELMVDACCTWRETIRVNQEDLPATVVRGRCLKLDRKHIRQGGHAAKYHAGGEHPGPHPLSCPKCGCRHACLLSNGRYQCAECHHQASVTAGTVLHRTHMPLTQWFLAFYFASQDKRGISAVTLTSMLGTTYKTAWYMLMRIRAAMGQRDKTHQIDGTIEFDDTYFGGQTVGKKRGRGTEKAKVFVAVSLDELGNLCYTKMQVTQNIKQASVKKFAQTAFAQGSTIHSDGYRSYIPALEGYTHEHKPYDPNSGLLHWLHIVISNAKAFILGTYHGLPKKYLRSYLDEYCFRFSRRDFGSPLLGRLALAVGTSTPLS